MKLSVKANPFAKKCIISVFLAIALIFTSVCPVLSGFDVVFYEKANADEILYGDIDFNGKISAADARYVLRAAAGLEELTEEQKIAADIVKSDPDKIVISSADARYILRTSVELEEFNNVTVSGSDYGDTDFEIGNIVVDGEDVSFDIIATSGSIENFDIELHYDPSVIELVNEEFISYTDNMPMLRPMAKGKFMYAANCHEAGKISFSGVFTENLAEDSGSSYDVNGTKIFTVKMKIKDDADIFGSTVKLSQKQFYEDTAEIVIDEANLHNHKTTILEEKAATCTEDGYQVYGCVCGQGGTTTKVIEALGHDNTVITTSKPTHISEGINFIYCNVCDYYATEEIPRLEEHTFVSVATAPTCTTRGYSTYICLCGESYIADYTDLIDHHDADKDYYCDTCEELLVQDTEEEISCDHMCHKDGFLGFIWKLINFFSKLFGVNPVCECGAAHY